MLNPFGEDDPGEHLRFSDLGQIEARNQSSIGLATIRTCGLDRDSLVRNRLEKARSAYQLVQELSGSSTDAERRKVLEKFYELGRAEYAFCGMVRIIFEEQCRVKWSVLEELRAFPEGERPRVVVVSARASLRDRAKASELGADAFVAKPFNVDDLLGVVRALDHAS